MVNRRMRYHEDCRGGEIFELDEEGFKKLELAGWVDTPAKLPEKVEVAEDVLETVPSDDADIPPASADDILNSVRRRGRPKKA